MQKTRLIPKVYSDTAYVDGVYVRDRAVERSLYYHCRDYFDENYRAVFFVGDEYRDEIFQESFIKLWENIRDRKIYVEDGELKGKDGETFSGKLTTYFMSIARLKYLEWSRESLRVVYGTYDDENFSAKEYELYKSMLYDSDDETKLEIIADCISKMPKRCNQILTMFYYDGMSLDEIIASVPGIDSKNALKTRKYKCLVELKTSVMRVYATFIELKDKIL
ncbi:MAG: sigma-70 family RNA polymerase sigma factor [Bacteroidales bacterium]|nr:sigma-70 family RNA polymerase sigma factor [Bacteroidales bacterium]